MELHNTSGPAALMGYVLMATVVGGLALRDRLPLFANRLANHMGRVSYGIYLLHMMVILATRRYVTDETWGCFIVSLAVVLPLASVVYWGFEMPFLRLKARYGSQGPMPGSSVATGLPTPAGEKQ